MYTPPPPAAVPFRPQGGDLRPTLRPLRVQLLKESLARCAILPWKGGDLAFAEANQLLSLDEVPQK